jgi:hypothetical protein
VKIDQRAEVMARAAIHAAVKQDFAKLDETLRGFSDDESTRKAVELTLAVILFVLEDSYSRKPDDDQVRAVAAAIAESEAWVQAAAEEISTFLLRLTNGEPFAGVVPTEDVFILGFAVAGYLLSSKRRDGEKWWDYLDRAEAALEAA